MTFSLVARCAASGLFGIGVCSSSPAIGARCAHARAGTGAVATQNITDPSLGPIALDLMQAGADAQQACNDIVASRPFMAYRQLVLVDAKGTVAAYSGSRTLGVHAMALGDGVAAAGNLLANRDVPLAMRDAFAAATGHLGQRIIAAMHAGLAAGGEAGPVHSAALVVVDRVSWPIVDLRVDWSERPIADLSDLWEVYRGQIDDYVQRAIDPAKAPSFGVAGDA